MSDRNQLIETIAKVKGYMTTDGTVKDPKAVANLRSRSLDRLTSMFRTIQGGEFAKNPTEGPDPTVKQTVENIKAGNLTEGIEVPLPAKPEPVKVHVEKDKDKITTTVDAGGGVMVDVVESKGQVAPVAPEDQRSPYKLEGSDRKPELLTKREAFARNSARSDGKKWVPAPEVKVEEAKAPNPIKTGKEREEALEEGRKADRDFDLRRQEALRRKQEEVDEHEGKGKTSQKGGTEGQPKAGKAPAPKAAGKKAPGTGRVRPAWEGLGMCAFIRVMAAHGFPKEDVAPACKHVGFDPDSATIGIQYKKGLNKDGVPKLATDVLSKIKAAVKAGKAK